MKHTEHRLVRYKRIVQKTHLMQFLTSGLSPWVFIFAISIFNSIPAFNITLSSWSLTNIGESQPLTGQPVPATSAGHLFSSRHYQASCIHKLNDYKLIITSFAPPRFSDLTAEINSTQKQTNVSDGSDRSAERTDKPHLVQRQGEEKGAGPEISFRVEKVWRLSFLLSLFASQIF